MGYSKVRCNFFFDLLLVLYLQAKGLNLSCVRTCCVIAEERPRIHLTTSFTKLFANLGLSTRAVSTSFGCRVNVGISFPVSINIKVQSKKYSQSLSMVAPLNTMPKPSSMQHRVMTFDWDGHSCYHLIHQFRHMIHRFR